MPQSLPQRLQLSTSETVGRFSSPQFYPVSSEPETQPSGLPKLDIPTNWVSPDSGSSNGGPKGNPQNGYSGPERNQHKTSRETPTPGQPQSSQPADPLKTLPQKYHPSEILPAQGALPPSTTGFGPVLRNTNFLKLWLGQIFSQLADKIYLVLMIALITTQFQTADQTVSGWVSSIMVAFTIPAVLFGSVAGVFVDRWSKKQVLVLTNLLRGGLVLLLPLLLWLTPATGAVAGVPLRFGVVLAVTFGVSTLTQFFAPAEQSAMPLVVERAHLLSANSLYTLTMMLAVIVGFAAGDPLLSLADRLTGYLGIVGSWSRELFVGGCYILASLLLLLMRTQEQPQSQQESPHVWQDIRDGWRYLQQQRQVRAALVQLVVLFSVFAALAVLVVRLAELIPEIEATQFGFLLAAGGVGMAFGVLLLGRLGQFLSHRQLSLVGSAGMALSLGGLSLFSLGLIPVLLLLFGLGACAALIGIPMQTTIQEETPEAMRGKIFGLQNNAVNIALSVPLALAGVAETFVGLQPVLLGLGVMMTCGGMLTWWLSGQPTVVKEV